MTNGRSPVTVITRSSAIRRPRISEVALTEPLVLRKLPFSSSQYGRGSLLAIGGGASSRRRQRAPQPRFSEPRALWANRADRLKQYRQKKYGRSCLLNNIGKAIKLKKIVQRQERARNSQGSLHDWLEDVKRGRKRQVFAAYPVTEALA